MTNDLTRNRKLHKREATLSTGRFVHEPTDPFGRLLFNERAMVANPNRTSSAGTREGMHVATAGAGSAANNPEFPGGRKPIPLYNR